MAEQTYKFHIGIDISKLILDVAISNANSLFQVANNETGLKELVKKLPNKKQTLIVLEASGGYERIAANYLRRKKFNLAIVNAKRVRDFAKASGKLAKTDRIDARVIMAFAKAFNPVPQPLSTLEEDKRLNYLKRRTQIVKMIATEKHHLEQSSEDFHNEIRKHIQYLEKKLSKIEACLKEQIKKDPEIADKVAKLDSIKGVGEVTAMNVLMHMPELGKLTPKEAAALAEG